MFTKRKAHNNLYSKSERKDILFQLHVWVSHCRKPSPWPAWSTLQPSWPWKRAVTTTSHPMDISIPNNLKDIHWHCWNSLFYSKKEKLKRKKIPAWTVQNLVMWYLNTMISICQRASPPTVKWLTSLLQHGERASSATTHLCFKKTNDQHIGIDWIEQFLPADLHVASIYFMDIVCVSTAFLCGVTPYFCMFGED